METAPETSTFDKEVVLHHIDKLYSTQTMVWRSINRIVLTAMILSFMLIALSTKFISLEEVVDIAGVRLKVSLAVLLSAGALTIAVLVAGYISQLNHAMQFGDEIKRLYSAIGYEAPEQADLDVDAFEVQSYVVSIMAPAYRGKESPNRLLRWANTGTTAIPIIVLVLIPIGAQIAAGLRVASLFGWRWWILVLFSLLVTATVSIVVVSEASN